MSQNWLDSQFEKKQFKQQLIVQYDGESQDLQNHEIDALAFAKSVDGYASFLKSLLEKAGFAKDVKIKVSASKPGSFDAVFEVMGTVVEYAVISAALAPWIGITPEKFHRSLKKLVVPLQEKLIKAIIKANGKTEDLIKTIRYSNQLNKEEEEAFIAFLNDISIRKGIDNFSSPLDLTGYESMKITDDDDQQFIINKTNRTALKYFPPDEVDERTFKDTVSIIYLSPENSKWQFRGKKKFWAEVKDQDFLDRTKHRRFSELSGKRFIVSGTRTFRREYGELRGVVTWEIHSASEIITQTSMFSEKNGDY